MRRKAVKIIGMGVVLLGLTGGILYFVFPQVLFGVQIRIQRMRAGLSLHEVRVGEEVWPYLSSDTASQGPVLVLVHGLGGYKDNWLKLALLLKGVRLIIPDLPGFGDHPLREGEVYSAEKVSKMLDDFFAALNLSQFHLAGVSMGGMVSGMYAAFYPSRIQTLTLMDTAGVSADAMSEFVTQMSVTGKNPLMYKNTEEFYDAMEYVLNVKPEIPAPMVSYLVKRKLSRIPQETRFLQEYVQRNFFMLDDELSKIEKPTLILWGEKDRIIDVSSVPGMKEKLKNSEAVILKGVCHAPMACAPEETAQALLSFIKKH